MDVYLFRDQIPGPADKYIFDSIENELDFKATEGTAFARLSVMFPETEYGYVDTRSNDDIRVMRHKGEMQLYGFIPSAVSFAVLNAAHDLGIKVQIMHFDKDGNRYLAQSMRWPFVC